jgi:alpha-L-fucosidase
MYTARKLPVFFISLIISQTLQAQKKIGNETRAQKDKRMAWWTHDRFGMFIHWGLYAQQNEQYQPFFELFNPDMFDPNTWAKQAKAEGMKYAVLTTKHHEGFCLFDSKYTDYKSTNAKAKRDLVREYVNAFRAEGIKIGFYYTLIDWHHPDFTEDGLHPLQPKNEANEDYAKINKGGNWNNYKAYLHNQIRELLTNYGKIDILWLDFSYPNANAYGKGTNDWGVVDLLKMIRQLQPGIIVDNRPGLEA